MHKENKAFLIRRQRLYRLYLKLWNFMNGRFIYYLTFRRI